MGIAKSTSKNIRSKNKPDERYLNGHPTRMEVANYVNALLEEHYMPHIQGLIQMSSMVLQAILIKKGVCTGKELKEITEEFVEEQKRRTAAMDKIKSGDLLKEVMTKEYVETLQAHANTIDSGNYSFQSSDVQVDIAQHIRVAADTLNGIFTGVKTITDDERESILKDLTGYRRRIEDDTIVLNKHEDKPLVIGMLWDAIVPFSQKQLINWSPSSVESDTGVVKTISQPSNLGVVGSN